MTEKYVKKKKKKKICLNTTSSDNERIFDNRFTPFFFASFLPASPFSPLSCSQFIYPFLDNVLCNGTEV